MSGIATTREQIDWIDADAELPDDGIDVLVVCPSPTYPVWIAHIDGDNGWCDSDGTQIAYRVTFWAEIPEGPK
jgi:hypothetical protein